MPFNQFEQKIHIPFTYWHFSICWNVDLQVVEVNIFVLVSKLFFEQLEKHFEIEVILTSLIEVLFFVWFDKKDHIFFQ
jgi:hypothetical protein